MNDQDNLKDENEGEGSKTADKQYRDAATEFAKKGGAVEKGLQAERDVEKNPREYAEAERAGRAHSAGDLRADVAGNPKKE